MSKLSKKQRVDCFRKTSEGIYYFGRDGKPMRLSQSFSLIGDVTADLGQAGRIVRFKDRLGSVRNFFVANSTSHSPPSLASRFADEGVEIAVGPAHRKQLALYVATKKVKKTVRFTRIPGWHQSQHDGRPIWLYVSPKKLIKPKGVSATIKLADPFEFGPEKRGKLSDWNANIGAACSGNPYLILVVSAALAAMLLRHLDHEPFGFHLVGSPGTGKTTAQRAACSVVGPPEYLKNWGATGVALEAVAVRHNDALLALNEIQQIDSKEAATIAYRLLNGQGRMRGRSDGGLAETFTWRIVVVSSGEDDLTSVLAKQGRTATVGQQIRLLDLPVKREFGLFDDLHGKATGKAFADELAGCANKYYGAPARKFIRSIVKDPGGVVDQAKLLATKIEQELLAAARAGHTDSAVGRAIGHLAVTAAAGELAIRLGIFVWKPGEATAAAKVGLKEWLRLYLSRRPLTPAEAVKHVCKTIWHHRTTGFADLREYGTPGHSTRLGFWHRFKGGRFAYLFKPLSFKKRFCRRIKAGVLISALKKHQLLEPGGHGVPTRQVRVPGKPALHSRRSFYVIWRDELRRFLKDG
jgi:putative DNA primase/helicase